MNYNNITVLYSRPVSLSDPYKDFSKDELDQIISTPDNKMGWHELSCIFQYALPAGEYEECAYFLPAALRFIVENEDNGASLICLIVHWVGKWKNNLEKESLFSKLIIFFQELFSNTLEQFNLKKNKEGYLYPNKVGLIENIITSFNEEEVFNNIGDIWLRSYLNNITNYNNAAWFLYLLDSYYGRTFIN